MTDEQIIKALECCMDRENKNCREADCPFYKFCLEDLDALQKASLDLINRLKAENDELKQELFRIKTGVSSLIKELGGV